MLAQDDTYRMMRGLWGLSDQYWSLVIQLAGLVMMFAAGMRVPNRIRRIVLASLSGLAVDIIAQLLIAGGGPEVYVGFVVFPILFSAAAELGRLASFLIGRARRHQ